MMDLLTLPTEIIVEILSYVDVEALLSLMVTNSRLYHVVRENPLQIIFPVLRWEFDPLEDLLRLYVARKEDVADVEDLPMPPYIMFKRNPDDKIRYLLVKGAEHEEADGSSRATRQNVVFLTVEDIQPLLRLCKVIRTWEEIFPQLRWVRMPENCRFLRQHELVRLRRAIYRWWTYSKYFHQNEFRELAPLPRGYMEDIRLSFMRLLPTGEIYELLDLMAAVFHLVQIYICPVLQQDLSQGIDEYDLTTHDVTWCDQHRLGRVMRTYAKLDPCELAHYFSSVLGYGKSRFLADVHRRNPYLCDDQESLQAAAREVLMEREYVGDHEMVPTEAVGGIVDFDDERDARRDELAQDASTDGEAPQRPSGMWVPTAFTPLGDDGSGAGETWIPSHSGVSRLQF